jgi:hypothetical protein
VVPEAPGYASMHEREAFRIILFPQLGHYRLFSFSVRERGAHPSYNVENLGRNDVCLALSLSVYCSYGLRNSKDPNLYLLTPC